MTAAAAPRTTPAFLREVAARHGARTALRFPDEGRELDYRLLEAEARRLAAP